MDREQVAQLIKDLLSARDEAEQASIAAQLDNISPDPNWSDHIFHSMEFYDQDDVLDIEAVVNRIFSYKPISL